MRRAFALALFLFASSSFAQTLGEEVRLNDPAPVQNRSFVRALQLRQMTVVLWTEQVTSAERDLLVARVQNGRRLDERGQRVARFNNASTPPDWDAASDGERVMVIWRDEQQNVSARLIDAGGIISEPFVIRVLLPSVERQVRMSLFWTGEYFALIWSREFAPVQTFLVSYRLLTSSGAFVRDGDFDLAGVVNWGMPFVRTGDGWRLLSTRGRDLVLLPLRNDFTTAGPPVVVATVTATEEWLEPRLALSDGGDRIFIVWVTRKSAYPPPVAGTIDRPFRAVVDASGRIISPPTPAEGYYLYHGVWTGTSFMIVPYLDENILRFSRDGMPLSAVAGTIGALAGSWPQLATGPSATVVTYTLGTRGDRSYDSTVGALRPIFEPAVRHRAAGR